MRKFYHIAASILIVIFILIQGKFILAPLVLSVFFGILVSPYVSKMEQRKWNPILATTIGVFSLYIILIGVVMLIINRYYQMVDDMPSFSEKFDTLSASISSFIAERTEISKPQLMEITDKSLTHLRSSVSGYFGTVWKSFSGFISFIVISPVFTFLVVLYRHHITQFVHSFSTLSSDTIKTWTETIFDIKTVVRKYSSGLLMVIAILATLNIAGLLILGIPFAIILGLSSAVLTVIPYVGNFLGGGLAAIVAIVMKDNPLYGLYVILLYVGIQVLEGNLITPKIMGNQMGVNPLVVIIALLVGGYIWGVIGMIISVPMVAVIKVLMERKEELLPLVQLMKEDE